MDVDNNLSRNTEEIHFDEEKVKVVLIFHEIYCLFSVLINCSLL